MVTSAPAEFEGDEFERRARTVLRGDENRLAQLLELRRVAAMEISKLHERALGPEATAPSAEELNETYNGFFYRAQELLGKERFEQIFGVAAGHPVDLVDPRMLNRAPPPLAR